MELSLSEKQKPILIHPLIPGGTKEIFVDPPLLTSHHVNWNKLCFFHFRNRPDTPEHYSAQNIIVVFLKPSANWDIWLDGKFNQVHPETGSVALFPANMSIRSIFQERISFISLIPDSMFLKSVAEEWIDPARYEFIPQISTQPEPFIFGTGLALKSELESDCLGGSLYYESMVTALIVHLLRHYSTRVPKIKDYQKGLSQNKLKQALDYLQEHLTEEVTLEAIALELDMSQYYFCRLFKLSMGISPHQYLNRQRIEQAKLLLTNEKLSVTEVAHLVGFSNQNHFTKLFRKLLGTTPGNYRKSLLIKCSS